MPNRELRPRAQRHVAIVDDDIALQRLLAIRLRSAGFTVTSFNTAAAALRGIDDSVDALLLDVRLPDADGLSLLRALAERGRSVPVVIHTAHASIELAVEAVALGATSVLTKPCDPRILLTTVRDTASLGAVFRACRELRQTLVDDPFHPIGESAAMLRVRETIAHVGPTDVTVLITGESGTGKELVARAMHARSQRAGRRFIALNCAAIPEHLVEAELFGHTRGAFTDAHRDREGLLAAAEGSTLFLDEIGDAPLSVQAKLLRVLEERTFRPVGATAGVDANLRVIAATNRDLGELVAAGRMREDLLFRLRVVPVHIPPLRERPDDIPLLAAVFAERAALRHGLSPSPLTIRGLAALRAHDWPGNVRELANVVEGAVLCGREIAPELPPTVAEETRPEPPDPTDRWDDLVQRFGRSATVPPLREARAEFERAYVRQVLRATNGNVAAAARIANRNRSEFYEIMKRHQITLRRRGI